MRQHFKLTLVLVVIHALDAYVPMNVQKFVRLTPINGKVCVYPGLVQGNHVKDSRCEKLAHLGPLKSTKSLSIALDKSAVPRGAVGGYMGQLFILGVLVRLLVKYRISYY